MVRLLRAWLIIFLAVLWLPEGVQADSYRSAQSAHAELAMISIAELPPESRDTLRTIRQGGPFAYPRDGVVFSNFERVLPKRSRGYYHEYTVKTPGASNRGTRRIISGVTGEYYFTADHYKTFKRIQE